MRPIRMAAGCAVLLAGFFVAGGARAGNLEPPGPPMPTMKTLDQVEPCTPITSLPVTITSAGSYCLTGNLTGVAGMDGITVTASDVVLLLRGFTLQGVSGSGDGVALLSGDLNSGILGPGVIKGWGGDGVSVTGGTLHFFDTEMVLNAGDGINAPTSSIMMDGQYDITGNGGAGIRAGDNSIIRGVTASGNGSTGIIVGANSIVMDSISNGNGSHGISVGASSAISNVVANGNTGDGLFTPGTHVQYVTATNNAGLGINCAGGNCRIANSRAESNIMGGIAAGSGSVVEHSSASGNGNYGIQALSGTVVRDCSAMNNVGATGILVPAANARVRIEGNHVAGNATGINVGGGGNTIFRNTARGNTTHYNIVSGNDVGPIDTAATSTSPWANIAF